MKPFFNNKDERTAQDGLLLQGQMIVVLISMQPEMKPKVNAGHLGMNP